MSNIPITPGTGVSSVATETVGGFDYQKIKVIGGDVGSTSVMSVNPDGSIKVSVLSGMVASVSGTVGASVIGTVPVTQVGAWTHSVVGTVFVAGSVATVFAAAANQSVSGTVGSSVIGTIPVTQAGSWSASILGGPITLYAPSASFISGVTSVITSTGLTSVLSAAGVSIKNYVTHIIVTNGAAVGTFVDVKDGGGNVLYSGYAAASGGGFSATMPVPLAGSANKSVDVQPRAQASIIAAMTGYTA